MALLVFSRCEGKPSKIPIDTGSEAERTIEIICTVSPAGAKCDVQISISGHARFEKPVVGSTFKLEKEVVPADGLLKKSVTLQSSGPGPFATIVVVLTEIPAIPGGLAAAPQQKSVIVRVRT